MTIMAYGGARPSAWLGHVCSCVFVNLNHLATGWPHDHGPTNVGAIVKTARLYLDLSLLLFPISACQFFQVWGVDTFTRPNYADLGGSFDVRFIFPSALTGLLNRYQHAKGQFMQMAGERCSNISHRSKH